MLLTYFLSDFEIIPVAPIITGITFVFNFHYFFFFFFFFFLLLLLLLLLNKHTRINVLHTGIIRKTEKPTLNLKT
jgi:hypothetical protein